MKNKNIITYQIEDFDNFYKEFISIVDISVDLWDYRLNPRITKADYFGKFQAGRFTIYHQYKYLFQRRIVLKINAEIDNDILSLNISSYNKWIIIVNVVWLTLASIFLMVGINFYIGLAVLLINILQTYVALDNYKERKGSFVKMIEKMIIKK